MTRWLGSGRPLPSATRVQYLHLARHIVGPLRAWLDRVRLRLDAPPTQQLVPGAPVTRADLIAVLRTAGTRFAREYWLGHASLVAGPDLGPLPDEFLPVPVPVVATPAPPKKRSRHQ